MQISDRQREWAASAIVRLRASDAARFAFDLVAGAGLLRQHREGTLAFCDFPNCGTRQIDESATSPSWQAGADLPVRIASHLDLVGSLRVVGLRRAAMPSSHWPQAPSTGVTIGVGLRVGR